MIREKLNQLIETISQNNSSSEILDAKKEFQKISGEIFEDDKSYESRMGSFLEWFTFDRLLNESSETPLQKYLNGQREPLSAEDRELFVNISGSVHGLFVVKKIKPDRVVVLELLDDKKYEVKEDQGGILFSKGDIFEARLISFGGQLFFSDNFCYHPQQTTGFIKNKIKEIRSVEKEDFKVLKAKEKELAVLQKKYFKMAAKVEKLNIKLDKASGKNKIDNICDMLNPCERLKNDLAQQVESSENSFRDWKRKTILIKHRDHRFRLIRRLSYMSLKLERSRQIDARDIYQD